MEPLCCFHHSSTISCNSIIMDSSSSSSSSRNPNSTQPNQVGTSSGANAERQVVMPPKIIHPTLCGSRLKETVQLPPGMDVHEWLAVNTVDFFNQLNILYSTVSDYCTEASCPKMSAGPKYEYRWADGVTIKKPIAVSAPKYVEYLMEWVGAQIDNPNIFPHVVGAPFPSNFKDVVKNIMKRMFRVYAHIYWTHFDVVLGLYEEAHLNTCFMHFVLFVKEFGLMGRGDLAPLHELVASIDTTVERLARSSS